MHATNCVNSIRSIFESVEIYLLELLLEVVTALEILDLSLPNSLSLLLVSFLLLLVHLKVLIIKFLRVKIHI